MRSVVELNSGRRSSPSKIVTLVKVMRVRVSFNVHVPVNFVPAAKPDAVFAAAVGVNVTEPLVPLPVNTTVMPVQRSFWFDGAVPMENPSNFQPPERVSKAGSTETVTVQDASTPSMRKSPSAARAARWWDKKVRI